MILTKAQRINACIRACAGIPDDVISTPGYSIKAELDTLDKQIFMRTKAERERDILRARLDGDTFALRGISAEAETEQQCLAGMISKLETVV